MVNNQDPLIRGRRTRGARSPLITKHPLVLIFREIVCILQASVPGVGVRAGVDQRPEVPSPLALVVVAPAQGVDLYVNRSRALGTLA